MSAIFFETQSEFRQWLAKNHKQEKELIVGYYKVATKKASMTWSESVDQALCFGWIDGIRRSINQESYSIRFTPRRKKSIWSAINIKKVEELTKKGLMTEAGLKAFSFMSESYSQIYSYENVPIVLDSKFEEQFKENKPAWDFFENQAPSYKKLVIGWIMTAKQEKTRLARLAKAIQASQNQQRIY